MDLNQLLHRHQIALIRAAESDVCDVRNIHLRFAAVYADRIDAFGSSAGADTAALARF